jgi:hypothetical protein
MNIDAIVITLLPGNSFGPAGATVTIGHVLATVSGPVSGLISGRSFGTSLTGGPVSSGPSFLAVLPCTGTGGDTITNQGAGITAGELTAGAIKDTASGVVNATQLSATTSSTVASVSVGTALSATAISVNAHAALAGGSLQTSGSVTIASLSVLGTTVNLPNPIPANYNVPIVGGTLTLNKHVVGVHGLLVEGIYLELNGVGTLVIGSASAYA